METLLSQIDRRIAALREDLSRLIIQLVNIQSTEEDALPGAPFGAGCRQVLDTMLALGKARGFFCQDYNTGVVSLALKEGTPDLGIWLHGDVVPAGKDWHYAPFDAIEYKCCVIGRGATDNKGQLAATFFLLTVFQELGIPLKYNPALYVGSNEETGMRDLIGIPGNPDAKGFLNIATPPRLSLVPDSGFPVAYGGRGAVVMQLRSNTPFHGCVLTAGQPEDPGLATVAFSRMPTLTQIPHCVVNSNCLSAWTPPRHGANPNPAGNMITRLAEGVLAQNLCPEEDTYIWEFLKDISANIYGAPLGIATDSEEMKPLTVFTQRVSTTDGCCQVTLNIRYPMEITAEAIIQRVTEAAAKRGFHVASHKAGTPAFIAPKDTPVVQALWDSAKEVTGSHKPPYTVGGGTYAHRLPNAYIFGMSGNCPPEDFPKGRGGAHGVDECVSLDRLQRAMRIYARALLRLNHIDW